VAVREARCSRGWTVVVCVVTACRTVRRLVWCLLLQRLLRQLRSTVRWRLSLALVGAFDGSTACRRLSLSCLCVDSRGGSMHLVYDAEEAVAWCTTARRRLSLGGCAPVAFDGLEDLLDKNT
jgi:hypothetical protein